MKIFKYIIMIGIACVVFSCEDANKQLYGQWQIYKYVGGPISALSDEEAQTFIGKEFIFNKRYAIINGSKLKNPSYTFREEQAIDYFYYGYRMTKEYIGIEEDVINILDISSSQPNQMSYEFLIQDDKLIISIDGVFFYLIKSQSNPQAG